jgi:hypothetical protein
MADRPFWVLFDTATLPDYYADVHKLLALPSGSAIRYDYRDRYLTDETRRVVGEGMIGSEVLVIYTQWRQYVRGAETPPDDTPASEIAWQAMRIGKMLATWRIGENNYFQFRVTGYPDADPALLEPIRAELEAQNASPFRRWVALSRQGAALAALSSARPETAWSRIVENLTTAPMQFNGDVFWRLNPPVRSGWLRKGKPLRSRLRAGQTDTPERNHEWIVPERSLFALPITLHSSHEQRPNAEPSITVETQSDGPLHPPSPASRPLRRNATLNIQVESKHTAETKLKVGTLTVASGADADSVSLSFEIRLARWKRALGALLMLVAAPGAAAAVVATTLVTDHKHVTAAVVYLIVIALIGTAGGFLYTGKLAVKT